MNNISKLKKQLAKLEKAHHNKCMRNIAKDFQNTLKRKATFAELRFKEIAEKKRLNLSFQHRVDIKYKGKILRFYITDFCDTLNKLVFEVDGDYHLTIEQQKKDYYRTKDLNRLGYKVFRILNNEVLTGNTTQFLTKAYKSININI